MTSEIMTVDGLHGEIPPVDLSPSGLRLPPHRLQHVAVTFMRLGRSDVRSDRSSV
jgi:hypothetical protein